MKRFLIWAPLALFLFFVGVAGYQLTQPKNDFVPSEMIGKAVPAFDLPGPTEEAPRVTAAIFNDGTPKLLNVWASWCAPCIAEVPHLEALKEQGAPIVGLAIRDRPEDIARFLETHGNPFIAIARDDISEVQLAIGSNKVPETFVVDGQGVIRHQHIGDVREGDVAMLLQKLEDAR